KRPKTHRYSSLALHTGARAPFHAEAQQHPQFRFQLQHETEPSPQCEALATNIDVFWVVFSPDESTIATAGADCTVRLWDSKTGEARSEVMQHEADAFVYSVAFSPDGNYIASADSRGRLFLWTAAGEPLGNFLPTEGGSENPEKQPVFAVKFSPDGDYIATASEDGNVKLWALEGQGANRQLPSQPIATLAGHRQGATSVDFSDDGLIATAGKDGTVRIWEMAAVHQQPEPQPIQVLSAYSQRVTWVEFQPTEDTSTEWLATASKDGSVIIWDRSVEGWGFQQPGNVFKRRYQFAGHQEGAFSATFIHDGQQIAVAQGDGDIKLWRLESTPQLIKRACQWLNTASATKSVERSSESSRSGQKRLAPDIAAVCRKYE
ncbi:MAG: WD40 repeat domain-containing protein, partial [Cyanobacteria bacterium J06607_6]